jgi:PAS domain S-box-containing protein
MDDSKQIDRLRPAEGSDLPSAEALALLPVPVAVFWLRRGELEPRLVEVNQAFGRLLGRRAEEARGRPIDALALVPRSQPQAKAAQASFVAGKAHSEHLSLRGLRGRAVEVACTWTPLPAGSGDGTYWTLTLTRNGGDEDLRRALRVSEDRLAAFFEYSPVDICLKDSEGRYLRVSRRFEELYGVTSDEVQGKLPMDIGVGDDWARQVREIDLEVLRSGQVRIYEEKVPFVTGVHECITVKFPLVGHDGMVQGVGTICTDITAHKKAERALLRSEREVARARALLAEAMESMTDGFVWFDGEGKLVMCNEQYRRLFPKVAAEFVPGASYSDLMEQAFDRDQFTVLAEGDTADKTYQASDVAQDHPTFRTKTSEGRWIEARNHPLEGGGFIGIRFDVTDRVAAEMALKESEQRFKDFAEAGPGGFWEMDESLCLSSFLDLQGCGDHPAPTASQALGCTLWDLFEPAEALDPTWAELHEVLALRLPIRNLRAVYHNEAGEQSYWRINGKPYYDGTGRFAGYRGVAEDVTAEVLARRRVEAAEARLMDAIESLSGGFALFDAQDRLVLCNETYRRRGYNDGRHIEPGITFEEVCRANFANDCVRGISTPEEVEAAVERRMAVHRSGNGSFEINWHDGQIFLMTERRTSDGGIAVVSTDITELKKARELAEQANKAKTRFLAAASHDLRQPLHAMELFIAALDECEDLGEVRCIASDLREASDAAGRLLNALLDVSELESGKLEGRFQHFPVQELLDRMLRLYGPQARERGLQLRMVASSQVIYSEVWDTGVGIPEAEHNSIFEEFHQLEGPLRQRSQGIGLGLSIVRRLANILGHEVFVHSIRGKGSAFSVELDPVPLEAPAGGAVAAAGEAAGRTILVLDDDHRIRKAMVRLLESWGYQVLSAEDRATACQLASVAPERIDLVIADYRLACDCNGVEAVRDLQRLVGRPLPVLIVTADFGPTEMLTIFGADFPALRKPVSPAALQAAVAGLLDESRPLPVEATAG